MATESSVLSTSTSSLTPFISISTPLSRRPPPPVPQILATLYTFPSMEPRSFVEYPAAHLNVPLRRDILHRAVVYEGDKARQGSANAKWRSDVHGSGRKLLPQKGTGRARVGDKKSPIRRGGGVAHGPKPRDFSTGLPKKIYDLAWRTALSYRYRRGELVVIGEMEDIDNAEPRWIEQIFDKVNFGKRDGRSLIVTGTKLPNLYAALAGTYGVGLAKTGDAIDVKDLLEMGRIVIEKQVLDSIFKKHSSDIIATVPSAVGI